MPYYLISPVALVATAVFLVGAFVAYNKIELPRGEDRGDFCPLSSSLMVLSFGSSAVCTLSLVAAVISVLSEPLSSMVRMCSGY